MKKKLNQLNRILILFLVTAICLTSCEKENLNEQENAEQIDFKVQTLSFKKLQSLNQKASKFIEEFNNKSITEGLGARTTEIYGKTVDTVSINYLEKDDGYSSTTLKVENDSIGLNHFENLLIEDYPDGNQSVKLVKYNLTKPVELIDSDDELNNSITSSEVSLYNSQTTSFSRLECVEIGYYTEVDACEGQLVTPGNEPWCFNEDGTRATKTVFVTIDEDCTWTSVGGSGTGTGGTGDGGNQNGGDNNNNGGGNYTGAGIFVPNIYSGEEDPNNPDFVLAGEVGVFFNNLPQNLQNLTIGNTWVFAYTVDYFRISRGGVNEENSQHVEDALSNFETFKANYYKPNRSIANNERLNFWAFYNLLHTGVPSNITDNTQDIFDIGEFLLNLDSLIDSKIITYLFNNYESEEATQFIIQLINVANDNLELENINDYLVNAISVKTVNPNVNPFLGADCRSFEYSQPPSALQRGCAVSDFNHTFYTAGIRPNGSPYYGEIDINYPTVYFTAPTWMTNGQAANFTAEVVTNAIKLADLYFFENPDVTEFDLAEIFKDAIRTQLTPVGGTFSTTIEPFPIPSPAPYITSVLGISDPYDCN